jgi:chromosome partitioning protein
MHVLAVASRKGGSGKTTLTGHIAVEAESRGAGPVAIIDVDPQGSLADWWNEREAGTPVFAQTALATLERDLERLSRLGIELVVIDTPPAITATISDVVALADLVVIPTRPSPHDLRSAGATVALAEEMGKPLVFVINGATPRAKITNEAVIALSQHGTLAPAIIHQRVDFAASMIDGRTVMELPNPGRSAEEIGQLWSYLDNRINKRAPRTILPVGRGLGSIRRDLGASGGAAGAKCRV